MNRTAYLHSLARRADLFWNQMDRAATTRGLVVKSVDGCRKAEITFTARTGTQTPLELTWYVKTFTKFPGYWQVDVKVNACKTLLGALDYAASQSCTKRAGYLKA